MELPTLSLAARGRKQLRAFSQQCFKYQAILAHQRLEEEQKCHLERPWLNPKFPYKKINPSLEIRILELAPGEGDSALCGSFVIDDMQTPSEYEAVSHHWGDSSAGDVIHCDGCELMLTSSIGDALRRFRRPKSIRRLWIDSICINQENRTEKVAQVRQMSQIYRSAQATLIWLGEEDPYTRTAFSIIEQAYQASVAARNRHGLHVTFTQLDSYGFFAVNNGDWSSLLSIVSRGWFFRTWVLQEVALATKAVMHCGGYSCTWGWLMEITLLLHYTYSYHRNNTGFLSPLNNTAAILSPTTAHDGSLWAYLGFTFGSHAVSDPRDKVFALLGLARDGSDFLHLVDYERDFETLYREVFKHYFHRGRPGLLNHAGQRGWRVNSSLPTWMPNWAAPYGFVSLLSRTQVHSPTRLGAGTPTLSLDMSILSSPGVVIDRVDRIRRCFEPGSKESGALIRGWRRLATRGSDIYAPTGETSLEAFAQTLVMANTVTVPPDSSKSEDGTSEGPIFASAAERYAACEAWLLDKTTHLQRKDWKARDVEVFQYYELFSRTSPKQTFFRGQRGYIGLGSFLLRPGDLVVELENGVTPYAIRPAGNGRYTFVGDIYVHGCMTEPVSAAERRVQTFQLV